MSTVITDYHFTSYYFNPPHGLIPPKQQLRLLSSVEPSRPSFCHGQNDAILNPYQQAGPTCVDGEDTSDGTVKNIINEALERSGFTEANCATANGTWELLSCRDAEAFYKHYDVDTSDIKAPPSWWSQKCCSTKEEIREYWWETSREIREVYSKNCTIIKGVMGWISTIASSIFIWMLRRSHDGFSTTQNRLLLGLCISDIVFSLHVLFFGSMAPKDLDYLSWNAAGNMITCRIIGVFFYLGGIMGALYNASLCALYLAIVNYEKSDVYIRAKLEPFFHVVPIVTAVGYCIFMLATASLFPDGFGSCNDYVYSPPHCQDMEAGFVIEGLFGDIPCQGDVVKLTDFRFILPATALFLSPIVMITCLAMIYRKVLQTERKMSQYGATSIFKKKATDRTCSTEKSTTALGTLGKKLKERNLWCSSCMRDKPTKISKSKSKTRKKRSDSRVVMYKGLAYSCSWLLTWGTVISSQFVASGRVLGYVMSGNSPLQGFFNLAIYMHPKILNAKKSTRGNLTWLQAFVKAFWSKGSDKKKRGGRRVPKMTVTEPNGSAKKTKESKDRFIMKADNGVRGTVGDQPLRTKTRLPQSEETQKLEPQDVTYLSFGRRTKASMVYHRRNDPAPPLPSHIAVIDAAIEDATSKHISDLSNEKNCNVEKNHLDISVASTLSAKDERVSDHIASIAEEESSLSVASVASIGIDEEKVRNKTHLIAEDVIHISQIRNSKDEEENALDSV